MPTEQDARAQIDELLTLAGWDVQDCSRANIHAARGVAIREFPLPGHGFADYLLYVGAKAAGVIEAKKQGVTLTGVETQSAKYTAGLPESLPAWTRPLPFSYQSTGIETRFTNGFDPEPRSRQVFAFHKPETLAAWLKELPQATAFATGTDGTVHRAELAPATFLARVRQMPDLITSWSDGASERKLWPAQITAIRNLEKSLAANRPRARIQIATGTAAGARTPTTK